MTDPVDSYWKEKANQFDQFYAQARNPFKTIVSRFLEVRQKQMIPILQRAVRSGSRVIDVGCGSGPYLEILLGMGASVVGVDYSEAMLRLAKPRLASWGGNITLVLGNAQSLMFASAEFDVAIAIGLLDYVAQASQVLEELVRLVKSGGSVIITAPKNPSPFFFIRSGIGASLRRQLFGLPPIVTALTKVQFCNMLEQNGVMVQEIQVVQETMWIAYGVKSKN
jgi:ubiquinone/menaquinone biosynthesis C-methylase UbiE